MFKYLFSPFRVDGLDLKNRLTMAPLFLGYAGERGVVTPALLEHYRLMARSGVALVMVENASIDHPAASGSIRELRADTDECLEGLARLADTIKGEGALAGLQLNHAGHYAHAAAEPVAPSAVEAFGRMPRALAPEELGRIAGQFAEAALRVQQAGFDMVELHGGTGYLLAEFISPRTNKRQDQYGGSLENRCRFPLEVIAAVKHAIGNFPVGYRFLADEWLPDGLRPEESRRAAKLLAGGGLAYLSVMGGVYESFRLPQVAEQGRNPGYMVELAAEVKAAVDIPVIAAGRINSGVLAERILAEGKADLIGLARVLWTDPEWPAKVLEGREDEIIHCDCEDACNKAVAAQKPAICARWPREKLTAWKEMVR
ncbi:MAG: NADH:flavin oxidoreductase [Actinobacteria bacterium]|nr:NADH:flavin oxidoreductase [Actinomycetota bacterium]